MSMDMHLKRSKFCIDWQMGDLLGTGSNGRSRVYRLSRNQLGLSEQSALKVIRLIEEQGNFDQLTPHRKSSFNEQRGALLQSQLEEVSLMISLKDYQNVVAYYDYEILDWIENGHFGTDFLIRMELLHAIREDMKNGFVFTEAMILKLGYDIAKALKACHRQNIIHRDIKPDNIFATEKNDFKLGDFGISKTVGGDALLSTNIGTRAYGAPEQYHSVTGYDHRVDIYSLGLTLYELANYNRLPFATSEYVTMEAIEKRMSGVKLPSPQGVSEELGRIILKACAYQPEERYQSAEEMLHDLSELRAKSEGYQTEDARYINSNPYWTMAASPSMPRMSQTPRMPVAPQGDALPMSSRMPVVPEEEPKNYRTLIGVVVVVDIVLFGFLTGYYLLPMLF